MARPEKIAEVDAIAEKLRSARSLVLADFTGLSVEQMTVFRSQCRSQGVQCRVVKNRLAQIAADQVEMPVLRDQLRGPTALVLGPESQVDPAKIVVEFAKDHEALQVKGGFLDRKYLDAAEIAALARIPGREELMAKMMGSLQSPLSGLAGVTNGVVAALVRAVDAVAKQKAA